MVGGYLDNGINGLGVGVTVAEGVGDDDEGAGEHEQIEEPGESTSQPAG